MPEPGQKSLKGYLLLDSGQLHGSFFQRTVVLICQHDSEGAFGLVLNKPAESLVGEVLLSDVAESVKSLPLFSGGPVQPGALSYLHGQSADEDSSVIPGVSMGHSLEFLSDFPDAPDGVKKLKLFAGYSGWSAGQLEDELRRQAWLVHPATAALVFGTPEDLWKRVLKLKGWKYNLLAQMPENPEWN